MIEAYYGRFGCALALGTALDRGVPVVTGGMGAEPDLSGVAPIVTGMTRSLSEGAGAGSPVDAPASAVETATGLLSANHAAALTAAATSTPEPIIAQGMRRGRCTVTALFVSGVGIRTIGISPLLRRSNRWIASIVACVLWAAKGASAAANNPTVG